MTPSRQLRRSNPASAAAFALALALLGSRADAGGTVVPGGDVSGTWTLAGSPYRVTGDLRVLDLRVEAGVVVRVAAGFEIEVRGRLDATGTAAAPILFTAEAVHEPWRGLYFHSVPPGSALVHCRVEFSDHGGIRLFDSTPVIRSCVIAENRDASFLDGSGAGIDADIFRSDLVIERCTIEGNVSKLRGGGLRVRIVDGTLRLVDCRIVGNFSNPTLIPFGDPGIMHFDSEGGGVFCEGDLEMRGCVVEGNTCVSRRQNTISLARGAGVFALGGRALLSHCFIAGNDLVAMAFGQTAVAVAHGGGVYSDGASLEIRNSVVAGNRARTHTEDGAGEEIRGAGIHVNGGAAILSNATVARNDREGISVARTTAKLGDSIVFGNALPPSGAVEALYSCVESAGSGALPGEGNIESDPLFVAETLSLDSFRLRRASPCVDAGDPLAAKSDSSLPPARGGARCDMGAFGGPGVSGFLGRAAKGNVNALAGDRAIVPVLSVNGETRAVTVRRRAPLDLELAAPPAGPVPARYVLWIGRVFAAGDVALVAQGEIVGALALPTPFHPDSLPQPLSLLRSRGAGLDVSDFVLGGAIRELRVPGTESAPFRIPFPAAFAPEAIFTVQGLVRDDGAANAVGWSVTNAVVVQVED